MPRTSSRSARDRQTRIPRLEIVLGYVVGAAALAMPLFTLPGYDSFRLPKEAMFRAEAMIICSILIAGSMLRYLTISKTLEMPRTLKRLILAIVACLVLTTVTSTNVRVSLLALEYSACALLVFAASFAVAKHRTVSWIMMPTAIAAVVTSVIALAQASSFWNPYGFDVSLPAKARTIALLGNSNDVGSYLVVVTPFFAAAAIGTRRKWWWLVAAVCAAGVIASGALAAIVALVAGSASVVILFARRRLVAMVVVAALAGAVLLIGPIRTRARHLADAIRNRDYPTLTSDRIYGIGTAWLMFVDRPLTGVGPGAFKFQYLPYTTRFSEQHPSWYFQRRRVKNFGQAHSDHAQILSETGLPGYALFLTALALIGRVSLARQAAPDSADVRQRFARASALPFAVVFGVLTLAAFPIELATVFHAALQGTAALLSWGRLERT